MGYVVGVLGALVFVMAWVLHDVYGQVEGLIERVGALQGEQQRHCRALTGHDDGLKEVRGELGTFGRWLALATANAMRVKELEARVNRLDPFGAPSSSAPGTGQRG